MVSDTGVNTKMLILSHEQHHGLNQKNTRITSKYRHMALVKTHTSHRPQDGF